jgi:ribosomal-protein-alanine N-acetyltransferase
MRMPELHTERLTIRPLADADLQPLMRALRVATDDPAERDRVTRYIRYNALADVVLAELGQPPYGDRAVVLRSSGQLIGLVGLVPAYVAFDQLREIGAGRGDLKPARHRPELGLFYEIDPDHRGRGYATEAAAAIARFALDEMSCARIVATTERDNLASQAVMRHLGMRMLENSLPEPGWLQIVGVLEGG